MNCKPGDLAVYVGADKAHYGWIVRVVRQHIDDNPFPSWWVDPPMPETEEWAEGLVYDHALRPIRDPGEDARDETLDWLPVPTQHKEPA
jgi:hypothetical protein